MLGIDSGAVRQGWAVIEGDKSSPPVYIDSGISGVTRRKADNEQYQPYRLRLIEYWIEEGFRLLDTYRPDLLASEIVPPATGRAFKSNGVQSQLAATAITVLQAQAMSAGIPVRQLGANTVKKAIAGDKEASKVRVRNGVYALIPELKDMKHHLWTKKEHIDESDGCAVGLTALGYKA